MICDKTSKKKSNYQNKQTTYDAAKLVGSSNILDVVQQVFAVVRKPNESTYPAFEVSRTAPSTSNMCDAVPEILVYVCQSDVTSRIKKKEEREKYEETSDTYCCEMRQQS